MWIDPNTLACSSRAFTLYRSSGTGRSSRDLESSAAWKGRGVLAGWIITSARPSITTFCRGRGVLAGRYAPVSPHSPAAACLTLHPYRRQ
ncbi:hypothetical protein Taro_009650 [Colocasia esculenta]|uniref:Uncharacterized protein n=1 Tax=Colocasia esculenta TaxID=4460 RepID=A0A843U0S1_COLES|nr:hypothetical protein [Colocasia esculenta]